MIDQLTRNKRAEFFMRRNFAEHITDQQRKNHLNAIKLIRGVPEGLRRIGRFNLPERETALRKALFISRRAAKLADVTIDAKVSVDAFERMDPKEKYMIWNSYYERAMNLFGENRWIRDDPSLMKQMVFLRNFFSLPKKIYEERTQHWRIIEKVLKRLTENRIDPKENYLMELERLVRRAKESGSKMKIFAMDVCVASSIYADIRNREGRNWSEAYQEGMEIAYSKIKEFHELVDAIIEL